MEAACAKWSVLKCLRCALGEPTCMYVPRMAFVPCVYLRLRSRWDVRTSLLNSRGRSFSTSFCMGDGDEGSVTRGGGGGGGGAGRHWGHAHAWGEAKWRAPAVRRSLWKRGGGSACRAHIQRNRPTQDGSQHVCIGHTSTTCALRTQLDTPCGKSTLPSPTT
jgi:hypothetical protein